jgi:hypothetical protein
VVLQRLSLLRMVKVIVMKGNKMVEENYVSRTDLGLAKLAGAGVAVAAHATLNDQGNLEAGK